jgi:hypothetical protein
MELVEAIGTATRDEALAARCAQITLALMAGGARHESAFPDTFKEMFK